MISAFTVWDFYFVTSNLSHLLLFPSTAYHFQLSSATKASPFTLSLTPHPHHTSCLSIIQQHIDSYRVTFIPRSPHVRSFSLALHFSWHSHPLPCLTEQLTFSPRQMHTLPHTNHAIYSWLHVGSHLILTASLSRCSHEPVHSSSCQQRPISDYSH